MHQKQYIQSLLKRYGLSQANPANTPADINVKMVKDDRVSKPVHPAHYQSMVGSLLYAAITTRPDIAHAVGFVFKFNSCPTEAHLTGVKWTLRYLKGTVNLGLKYSKLENGELIGLTDADWAGDMNDRHSITGNLFLMSGGAESWTSKRQPVVALSTTKAEYVALGTAVQEAVWLRRLLSNTTDKARSPTIIKEDNQGTIAVARNPISNSRTKYIDIKFCYIHEALQDGTIELVYCPSDKMVSDLLTKPLPRGRFKIFDLRWGSWISPNDKSIQVRV